MRTLEFAKLDLQNVFENERAPMEQRRVKETILQGTFHVTSTKLTKVRKVAPLIRFARLLAALNGESATFLDTSAPRESIELRPSNFKPCCRDRQPDDNVSFEPLLSRSSDFPDDVRIGFQLFAIANEPLFRMSNFLANTTPRQLK